MKGPFPRIGLFTKHNSEEIKDSLVNVISFLESLGHTLVVEESSATILDSKPKRTIHKDEIGEQCDLVIVVGGDGSLLRAARAIIQSNVPIVGINRGRLGFLADIRPDQLEESLKPILEGSYTEEERTLLDVAIMRAGKPIDMQCALNDVVLYTGDIARMIEFEIFIDDQFVLYQRADGLIAATPTGSTAYSLSGGGPILYPTLSAFTLVPMFPHTLSSRPIVISDQSKIKLVIPTNNEMTPKISCDGQVHLELALGDEIHMQKHPSPLRLIHPKGYNYFALLRQKLGWNTHLTSDRVRQSKNV